MRDYHYGVFIGRFQPLHMGHQHVVEEALKRVETLIVVIGSAFQARTPVNPFTYQERNFLFQTVYRHEIANGRMIVLPATDDDRSDITWSQQIAERVNDAILSHANNGGVRLHGLNDYKIALTGFGKDASSFYLKMFPQWASIQIDTQHGTISSTDIREDLLRRLPHFPHDAVAPAVLEWLKSWALTDHFRNMTAEATYYRDYPKQYGKGPFLTVDALVRWRGKILLVTRGKVPGKGLLAMPGGFLEPNERLFEGALRELNEETRLNERDLSYFFAGRFPADNPKRSLRGRVLSEIHFFDVPDDEEMTKPVGSDDAAHADWYDFADLEPERFFEDHHTIISEFLNEGE